MTSFTTTLFYYYQFYFFSFNVNIYFLQVLKFQPLIVSKSIEGGMSSIDGGTLVRLWLHEVLRVFGDRLIELSDQEWLLDELRKLIPLQFGDKIETYLKHLMKGDGIAGSSHEDDEDIVSVDTLRRLLFVEFLGGPPPEGSPEGTPGGPQTYMEVKGK